MKGRYECVLPKEYLRKKKYRNYEIPNNEEDCLVGESVILYSYHRSRLTYTLGGQRKIDNATQNHLWQLEKAIE